MPRPLPTGLSDAQRSALLEFYAGHITAGQFTERIGIERPPRTVDGPTTQAHVPRVAAIGPAAHGDTDPQGRRTRLTVRGLVRKWLRRLHDRTVRPRRQPAV